MRAALHHARAVARPATAAFGTGIASRTVAPSNAHAYAGLAAAGVAVGACAYHNEQQKQAECSVTELLPLIATAGMGVAAYMAANAKIEQQEAEKAEMAAKFQKYWPRKIMMIFGPPGAGKGTQGPKIEDLCGIPQLSTGDMIRAAIGAGTPVGLKVKDLVSKGALVSDDIVLEMIETRIQDDDCKNGFILDGFPRTMEQAKGLDKLLNKTGERVTRVMALDVPDSILEERICGRWIHKKSGTSYHVKFAPPKSMELDANGVPIKESMKDDATGEPLMQRPDDTAAALKNRLATYHKETTPILNHYGPKNTNVVVSVNANQSAKDVWAEIESKL